MYTEGLGQGAELIRVDDGFVYRFTAMGSPCEVRVECRDAAPALTIGKLAEDEAIRVERKFSRYRPDSEISRINASAGLPLTLDEETAALIAYTAEYHRLSGGLFDITSGVLRRIWIFDGSDRVPAASQVKALLPLIGWHKVSWRHPIIALPAGMEIDLGGVGKEYAVDRAVMAITAVSELPTLVNFGGDLRVTGPRADGGRWRAAIESVDGGNAGKGVLELAAGALTTSGDARRFLFKDGVRYSHILDPRTGWPVMHPPRSVTVAAPSCVEAGLLSTLTMLKGRRAEQVIKKEGIRAWCVR